MELEQQINQSQTPQEIRKETNRLIQQSHDILQKIREKHGLSSPEYKQAWQEYQELRQSIISALENDRSISKRELALIELELSQLSQISQGTQRSLLDKASRGARMIGLDTSLLSHMGVDVSGLNAHQHEIVEKIIGSNIGYGNGYLHGYSKEKGGNYVISIPEFEKELGKGNIRDINSKALSNYFLYLNAIGQLKLKKLVEVFGENNLFDLQDLWLKKVDKNDDKKQIAKETLEKKGVLGSILSIIDTFSSSQKLIHVLTQTSQDSGKRNKEQEEVMLLFIQKNAKEIRGQMKKDLKAKFLETHPGKEKEAEEVVENMLAELLKCSTYEDIPKALSIFERYNSKYNFKLNIPDEARKWAQVNEQTTQERFLLNQKKSDTLQEQYQKALKKGDMSEAQRLKSEMQAMQKELEKNRLQIKGAHMATLGLSRITDGDVHKLIKGGKKGFDEYTNSLLKNKEFAVIYKEYSTSQAKFYEKYPEEKQDAHKENRDSEIGDIHKKETTLSAFSYSDGTRVEFSQESNHYDIQTEYGEIEVDYEEFTTVKNNQEALKNMIHFKKTLDELGLGALWKMRHEIFQAMKNKYTLAFNLKDDFINEREVHLFLTSILDSLQLPGYSQNILQTKQYILELNHVGVFGNAQEVGVGGKTTLEKKFMDTFFDPNQGFLSQKFGQALSKK